MEPIERLKREVAYHGNIIDMYDDTVKLPGGKIAHWDYIHHMGAAAVLPILPDGQILLVRQYRNALDRFTLEIPAGKLDAPDEDMAVCAARELEEETGWRCDHLEYLMTLHTWVAFCNEEVGVYIARDLIRTESHPDEDEDIEVCCVTPEEAGEMIRSGRLTDAKTVSAILAYLAESRG